MPGGGSEADGASALDDLADPSRKLAGDRKEDQDRRESDRELRRQDDERLRTQIFEEMDRRYTSVRELASGVTGERVGTVTGAGEVRGVSSSGSLPALGEVVGLPGSGASISADSHRAEVGSREFGSLKQSVPKFSGKLEDFPLLKAHFEVFTSMVLVWCIPSFLLVHDIVMGDVTKDTQHFFSQGLSDVQIKTAAVSWACLTENIVNRDLLGRVFAIKSPNAGWRMLCDWFLPKTMAGQVKWSVAYDVAKMRKREEPIKYFGRADKIVGVLASLGVTKSDVDVNRNITMSRTADSEIEERTILCRESITRSEIDFFIRQRYIRIPASKRKNVGQALFSNGAGRGVLAGRGNHRSISSSRNRGEKGSSSSNPPAPTQDTPPRLSTK